RLDRMGRNPTLTIISDVTGGKELPRVVEEEVLRKASGIPLFVEELTKNVLDGGLLHEIGDQYIAVNPLPALTVPFTLAHPPTGRLDRLGPAKEVAQLAAVIGFEFPHSLLAKVAAGLGQSLETSVAQLIGAEVIFVRREFPDLSYEFKHA